MFQQLNALKAPNSKLQIPRKLQISRSKQTRARFCFSEFEPLKFLWSLVLGVWNFAAGRVLRERLLRNRKEKQFVIPVVANIFRGSCQNLLLEAKPRKRWRNDSRSRRAAKSCARNRHGVTCSRPKTRNANGSYAKWCWSIRRMKPGLEQTCRTRETVAAVRDRSKCDASFQLAAAERATCKVAPL